MAITEPPPVVIVVMGPTIASTAAVTAMSSTTSGIIVVDNASDYVVRSTNNAILTVVKYDADYYVEKDLIDWRGLEKCIVGFKPKFNSKYTGKACSYIKQPARQYSQKRKMYVQKLKSQL